MKMKTSAKKRPARRRPAWKPLLGYSTNVHRGETLEQIYANLKRFTIPIRKRVFGDAESGLELHIGMSAGSELRERRARQAFGAFLKENGLQLFSVNAYPLKSFHTRRVKEQVYSPSWTEGSRCRWTILIAEILADLLPPGLQGSVSTLGGAYRHKEHGPATFRKLALQYLQAVDSFHQIEQQTGKTIVLAVEPEPETTFETAGDIIGFYESYLYPAAKAAWGRKRLSEAKVEERLRRFFTVNFDTCHFSVLFEDLVSSLRELNQAGLAVGKVHVTNAIRLTNPLRSPAGFQEFRGMHEPRYFHQFCGANRDGDVVWRDVDLNRLPRELKPSRHSDLAELRSHYHVPLYLKRFGKLHTTIDDTLLALREIKRKRMTNHVVIETYTWPILQAEEKLVSGISKEFRWLLEALKG